MWTATHEAARLRCLRWPLNPILICLLALSAPAAAAAEGAWLDALRARDTRALGRLAEHAPAPAVNAALPDGTTALMVAARQGPRVLVQRLLGLGADPGQENHRGGTALMYAAVAGDPVVLRMLLAAGAPVSARASNGWTALTIAAAKGHGAAVRLLLSRGADPDVPDIYGATPLIRAVEGGYAEAARVLLEAGGAVVDAEDESGATALHHAAANGDSRLVRLLLARGADPLHRTGKGLTPGDVARLSGSAEVAAVLGGADPSG